MQDAMSQAGIDPSDVDYINTHGTSSPIGDQTEIAAIGECFAATPTPWLNATKGLTGHCIFAAGVVEAVATVIQMQERFLHPNRNLESPIDTHCRFVGSSARDAVIRVALSNSFGFGGINTSIVIGRD